MIANIDAAKEFLAKTPFFGGLADHQLEALCERLGELRFAKGEAVFREGENGSAMFVVASGDLVACQRGEHGHVVRLKRFGVGDFFGETTLIEMQPRPFTVLVERSAELFQLTNMDLYKLYKDDVKAYVLVLQNINRELCRRLRRADKRITQMADEDGDETTQIRKTGALRVLPTEE